MLQFGRLTGTLPEVVAHGLECGPYLVAQCLAAVFGAVNAAVVVISDGPLDPLQIGFQGLCLDRQLSEVDETWRPPQEKDDHPDDQGNTDNELYPQR